MGNDNNLTDGEEISKDPVQLTVAQCLDHRIKIARESVEKQCILKAKAETLGILEHPMSFYTDMVFF